MPWISINCRTQITRDNYAQINMCSALCVGMRSARLINAEWEKDVQSKRRWVICIDFTFSNMRWFAMIEKHVTPASATPFAHTPLSNLNAHLPFYLLINGEKSLCLWSKLLKVESTTIIPINFILWCRAHARSPLCAPNSHSASGLTCTLSVARCTCCRLLRHLRCTFIFFRHFDDAK